MKRTLALLLSLTLLLAACGGGDDPQAETGEDAPTDAAAAAFSLNGVRYCEILYTTEGEDGAPVTEVWGTPGIDPCEDDAWDDLDPAELAAELDATYIDMNGPRYFVVDGQVDTAPADSDASTVPEGEPQRFGDIQMRLLASLDEPAEDEVAYVPTRVVRTVTWTFDEGSEIYELTDPDGNTYVMQSYALIVDSSLAAQDLPTLGDRLDLPEGWTYSARTLDAPLVVGIAPEGALVVNDELRNSYQLDDRG